MAVAIALVTGLIAPAPAGAVPHASDPLNTYWGSVEPGGNGCSSCHTLKASEGDPNTSYIISSSRTFPDMKSANGGVTPANLGCTYCHNRATVVAKMKGALSHFSGQRSQHPVGRKFIGGSAYTDTQGEYLSSAGSNTAEEMDCVDCHDAALVAPGGYYMAHADPPASNPFMLLNVSTPNQYDGLCRTCHGALAAANWKTKGKDIRVTSHLDGRDTANALAEADGTLLLTSDPGKDGTADTLTNQCAGCHEVHGAPNAKLFTSAFSNGTDCTACHLAGDRYDNYTKHGHGKTTPDSLSTYEYGGVRMDLAMPCTDCHVALDISTTNLAGTRKKHNEKRAISGNRDDYKANFNLSKNVNSADPGTPTGNPEWGVCISCHALATYKAHVSYEGAPRGCQDCHDEHAEGSGVTSNVFMISEKSKKAGFFKTATVTPAGTETVTYTMPRYLQDHVTVAAGPFDFYRADGNGACDNTECHGTVNSATVPGPLSQLMGTSSANTNHSGGYQAPGSDCEICHNHKDPQGGWGASASCDDCHGSAGLPNTTGIARTHTDTNESLTYHNQHANSTAVGQCNDCHIHDGKTVPAGTGTHMNGTVNFGGLKMDTTLNYSASGFGGGACLTVAANGCHDGDAGDWKLGLANGDANGCVDCHDAGTTNVVDAGKSLDQGGYPAPGKSSTTKHTKHINNTAYVTGSCADCHGTNANTGAHATHVNGTADTAATAKLTSYASANKTCVTSCHLANTLNDWTNAVLLACADCHAGTYIGGGANMPATGLHTGVPTVTGVTHDDSFPYNGGGSTAVCTTCHTGAISGAHVTGTIDTTGVLFNANVVFTDGTPPTCAPSLAGCHTDQRAGVGTWSRKWNANATATDGTECAGCHGGTPLDATPTVWTSWNTGAGTLNRPNMTGTVPAGPVGLTSAHDSNWDGDGSATEVSPNHAVCKNCHGMNSQTDKEPTYTATTMWDPTGVNSFHGNGSIDLNGPSAQSNLANTTTPIGAEYNGNDDASLEFSDYSCTKACHQGPGNDMHNMGDSAWPLKYGNYGAGNCNGCHGYPPLNAADFAARGGNYVDALVDTTLGGYAGGGDAHNAPDHVATTVRETDGWTPCIKCHPSATHAQNPLAVQRANIQVTIAAAYDDKAAAAASWTAGAGPAASFCSNVSCHGGVTTPFWSGGTIAIATQCTLCHIYENVASRAAATQWNSAITGVHAVTTTVSGQNHSLNAAATCGGATSCHIAAPTNHLGANLNDSALVELTTATAGLRAGITVATGPGHDPNADTCLLACHKEGATWARLNDRIKATALITDTAQVCATCHGTFASGWTAGAGVINRPDMTGVSGPVGLTSGHASDWDGDLNATEVAGSHGTCKTCHGMNSPADRSTNYLAGTTVGAFWNPAGVTGFHGNGSIDMNGPSAQSNLANNATAVGSEYNGNDDASLETSDFSCTAACHAGAANANHNMGDSQTWPVKYGDYGKGSCDGCHGGGTVGTNAKNYWPDDSNANAENTAKRHPLHMTKLALARYSETIALLLTDNTAQTPGVASSAKQVELCSYCHTNPGTDGDHGVAANLPAEVNTFYTMWLPKTLDNGLWAVAGGGTCATTDCHFNKATTNTVGIDFSWNGNSSTNTTACIMCHTDIQNVGNATGRTHQAHVTTGTGGGSICADCHAAATWGAPGTVPATGHTNGTFQVTGGGVTLTYTGVYPTLGTCGINLCHNNGQSVAAVSPYTWGTILGGGTNSCTECHGTTSATLTTQSHPKHNASPNCTKCHAAATVNTHANGSINLPGTLAVVYTGGNTNVAVGGGTFGTCTGPATGCHMGSVTPNWNGGTTNCSSCHGYPPTAGTSHLDANRTGYANTDTTFLAAHTQCDMCHGVSGNSTYPTAPTGFGTPVNKTPAGDAYVIGTMHGDGSVQMNGAGGANAPYTENTNYNATTWACDNAGCHTNAVKFNASSSSVLVEMREFGTGTCDGCHTGGAGGAPVVIVGTTSHTSKTRGVPAAGCTDCHAGGTRGAMHSKSGNANVVAIPNNTNVGINYAHLVTTGVSGIVLGGDITVGTTEAEICWNCHALSSPVPSEWGTNTDVAGLPAHLQYNYGSISTANWIGATWYPSQQSAPSFMYKTGAIKSTHTANPAGGVFLGPTSSASSNALANPDTVAQIRCTYCHDVHDLNKAHLDTATGKPWIRGNWISSPYKQDGAPQSGQAFTNTNSWGAVPRATSNTAQLLGGYWIDRNMASPTSGMTANQFGGLCALCHGQTKGAATWSSAGIDAINQFEANGAGWVSGLNGHKNSVKGATGTSGDTLAARNIYNARGGTTGLSTTHSPMAHYQGAGNPPGDTGTYGFRGYSSTALRYQPTITAVCRYTVDEWTVDEYGTVAQNRYHLFSCSKCHTPHASRLPKLMITNCLDTKHNTWDNSAGFLTISQTSAVNRGRSRSNLSSAQNCHRLRGNDLSDARDSLGYSGAGWNTVTPW